MAKNLINKKNIPIREFIFITEASTRIIPDGVKIKMAAATAILT
jgi:hypothetical protein